MGSVVVGVSLVTEGYDGSDRVSGNDKNVSDEMSMGSFSKFLFTLRKCVCHPMWKSLRLINAFKDFHEIVKPQEVVLKLKNLIEYLGYFVGKLFELIEGSL